MTAGARFFFPNSGEYEMTGRVGLELNRGGPGRGKQNMRFSVVRQCETEAGS